MKHCKIISENIFFKGPFFEGHMLGGAYLRKETGVSKSIGLALKLKVNLLFLLCFTLHLRAIFQVQAPGGRGAHIWRGVFLEFYSI